MGYSVKILLDSVNSVGDRLTTFELTYPRFIHSEFMTHRMFSRNSASSRAIPIEKMIERVENDPVIPVYWGKNQKGMQAAEELDGGDKVTALVAWLHARDVAIEHARRLISVNTHKQIVNRLLEPWMWITVICSATTYSNFFKLRCHPDAQPEIQKLAYMMRREMYDECVGSRPKLLLDGEYHCPLVPDKDEVIADLFKSGYLDKAVNPSDEAEKAIQKISVGRCARVSYLTHHGIRDTQADIDLHDRLLTSGHWSPFEHVAYAAPYKKSNNLDRLMNRLEGKAEMPHYSNFQGWVQYRKQFEGESGR